MRARNTLARLPQDFRKAKCFEQQYLLAQQYVQTDVKYSINFLRPTAYLTRLSLVKHEYVTIYQSFSLVRRFSFSPLPTNQHLNIRSILLLCALATESSSTNCYSIYPTQTAFPKASGPKDGQTSFPKIDQSCHNTLQLFVFQRFLSSTSYRFTCRVQWQLAPSKTIR